MKSPFLFTMLFAGLWFHIPVNLHGQGWERVFDFDPKFEYIDKMIQTRDSNFVIAASEGYSGSVNLIKIDRRGNLLWKTYINKPLTQTIHLHELPDGDIILISINSYDIAFSSSFQTWLRKFTGNGQLAEEKEISVDGYYGLLSRDVLEESDAFLIAGSVIKDSLFSEIRKPVLYRLSYDGNITWQKIFNYFPSSEYEEFTLVENTIGDGYFVMHAYDPGNFPFLQRVIKIDSAYNEAYAFPCGPWAYTSDIVLSTHDSTLFVRLQWVQLQKRGLDGTVLKIWAPGNSFEISEILLTDENKIIVIGLSGGDDNRDVQIVVLDDQLNPLWQKTYDRGMDFGSDIIKTFDKGLLLGARTYDYINDSDLYLIRTDSNGNSITNLIQGKVVWDTDKNCALQPDDPVMKSWIVTATGGYNNDTLYKSTDTIGYYAFRVDTGHYVIRAHPHNALWDAGCVILDTVLTQAFDTLQQDFPVRAAVDCPGMEVSTAVGRLRPCFASYLQVWYCNNGSVTAEDAEIQLILDEHMNYDSASIAPAAVSGDTLWFALGDVAPFECHNFFVRIMLDCDTALLDRTLCYQTHTFPDTSCLPPANWSGAQIWVSAVCTGDSVRLVLYNIGTAPSSTGLEYIIIEDNVILMQAPYSLNPGDSLVLMFGANSATWRIIAEQEPGFLGGFFTSIALEGCGEGNSSTGYINQFPEADEAPWLDRECRTVTGSYDPNDKSAAPEGYTDAHFIAANTDLEYLIRFQNTGSDTAFSVVIRDQISPLLDPTSIRPGASSHPFTWSLDGTGMVTFSFPDILLPDSTTNKEASQGFVSFRIAQQPDLPQGTYFENQAAIYFDFNAFVQTNTVFHTIMPLFEQSSSVMPPPFAGGEQLKIWPNPAVEIAYISFKDNVLLPRKLSLYNLSGQLYSVAYHSENTLAIRRGNLAAGIYVIRVETDDGQSQAGIVVFR